MNVKEQAQITDEQIVKAAVERCGGNARALSRALGVNPMRVYQWIRRRRLSLPWRLHLSSLLADPAWPPPDRPAPVRRSTRHGAP